MAEHDLYLIMPAKVLLNKDAELDVYSDKVKLGKLMMSRGSIAWLPGHHKTVYHLEWETFSELMQDKGRPRKTTE